MAYQSTLHGLTPQKIVSGPYECDIKEHIAWFIMIIDISVRSIDLEYVDTGTSTISRGVIPEVYLLHRLRVAQMLRCCRLRTGISHGL